MNRWWIALVAGLAVVLALVLFRQASAPGSAPSTDEATPKTASVRRDVDPATNAGVASGQAVDPNKPVVGQAHETHWEDLLTPEEKAARDIPEVWTARESLNDWMILARSLPDDPAQPDELADKASAMVKACREFYAKPDKAQWPAIEQQQKDVLAAIRKSGLAVNRSSQMDDIEAHLKDYDAGQATRPTDGGSH